MSPMPFVPLQEIPVTDSPYVLLFGGAYLLVVLAIGVWGYMQTESTEDFLITGKSIGTWVLALTAFSVIQSGFGFVGGPELVYSFGTTALWIFFTAPLGFVITWVLLAKRMRLLADIRDVMTLADGMYVRYESAWVRGLTAVAVIVGVMAYLATNLAALQYVMRAIFGLPVMWGLLIGALILLLYSMLGGMIAGVWTDFVQAITMIVGSIFVFAYALSFGGGMGSISHNLATADPAFVSPFGAMGAPAATIFTALGWWILFSVGAAGQPHLVTKFYMSRNLKILRWGAPIAAATYAISSLLAFSTGLSMRAMVEAGQTAAPKSASVVGPVFVLEHTPGVVAGLILAALLAAIMSTSDSFLNIGAAAVSRDIPRALGRPIDDDKTELRVTQAALAGLTIASTLIVFYSQTLRRYSRHHRLGLFRGGVLRHRGPRSELEGRDEGGCYRRAPRRAGRQPVLQRGAEHRGDRGTFGTQRGRHGPVPLPRFVPGRNGGAVGRNRALHRRLAGDAGPTDGSGGHRPPPGGIE